MSSRFIIKREQFLNPPNKDPLNREQWIPKVSWNGQSVRGVSSTDCGGELCVSCGRYAVRGVKPSRKQKAVLKRKGNPRLSTWFGESESGTEFVGYHKFPAVDGLCSYCHSKGEGVKKRVELKGEKLIQLTAHQRSGRLDEAKVNEIDKGWKTSIIQKKKKPGDRGKVFVPGKSDGVISTARWVTKKKRR